MKSLLRDILVAIDKLYRYYVPPFKPELKKKDWGWVVARIRKLPNIDKALILRTDGWYYTVDYETFVDMVAWDWTDTRFYLVDQFDCDKFALYFKVRMALNFGMNTIAAIFDYDAGHAYNVVLLDGIDDPVLFEPQTDEMFTAEVRDRSSYALEGNYFVII